MPINGKEIMIWKDIIMGNQLLKSIFELLPLKVWLDERNKTTLIDISRWYQNLGRWLGWNFEEPLIHMEHIMVSCL